MDFDQLKIIWDEQRAERLYAFDEAAFQRQIAERCKTTRKRSDCSDAGLIAIYLLVGLALFAQPLVSGSGYHKLFGSVVFLGLAAYVWLRRKSQLKRESRFDESISGLLARALARQRSHVRLMRSMVVWVGLPYTLFVGVNFYFQDFGQSLWWFASMLLPVPLMYLVVHYGLRSKELPRLRELESLHAKFSEN